MKLTSAISYYLTSIPTLLFRSNAIIAPLLKVRKPILITLDNGMKYYVSNLMDIWTLKEVILDRQYERFVSLPQNGTVIDIGGAIGEFALYAALKKNTVYAYEIDDERVDLFHKNQKINNAERVTLHHTKATSLDKIFKENKIEHCDLLKIDCEGDEYPIFHNTSDQTLKKIDAMTMEVHFFDSKMKSNYIQLRKRLQKHFTLYYFPNQVHDYIGYLACKKKK